MSIDVRWARRGRYRRARATGLALAILAAPACVASSVVARSVTLGGDSARVVTQAAKAQLIDGSIVVLPDGFRVEGGQMVGAGWRYGAMLRDSVRVSAIPTDSIAGAVSIAVGCAASARNVELGPYRAMVRTDNSWCTDIASAASCSR